MKHFRIVTGQERIFAVDDNESFRVIKQIYLHEEYNQNYANDIALVILKPSGTKPSAYARPACLPNPIINNYSEDDTNQRLIVTGFGRTENGLQYANELRSADLNVISTRDCQQEFDADPGNAFLNIKVDHSTNLCGKDEDAKNGRDAQSDCLGDSGGPVIVNKDGRAILVGIVSWGQGCSDPTNHFPSVFTRVRCYLTWINEKLGHVDDDYDECNLKGPWSQEDS